MIKKNNFELNTIVVEMPVYFIITKSGFKYCVTQSPNSNNIENYKNFLLKNEIKTLVKLCDETIYDVDYLISHGIDVINIPLEDGKTPSKEQIKKWIKILKNQSQSKSIAVHCMSGLGRAPLFVGIGLIIIEKMHYIDAILKIRNVIKFALNNHQIKFLENLNVLTVDDDTTKYCFLC